MNANSFFQRLFKFIKKPRARVYRSLPRGLDVFYDLKIHLPNLLIAVVFDVGANTGQSARVYSNKFTGAKIYSFEPVEKTFLKLQENVRGRQIECHRLALSALPGSGIMILEGTADMFHLQTETSVASAGNLSGLEEVPLETLDNFCRAHGVEQIGYLKIDTEGNDLAVLQGADMMLSRHQIDVVEVEAGMNCLNKRHVPYEKLSRFLQEKGYFPFGIYEQTAEFPTREPHLRRTNCVFISEKVSNANRAS
jgi:FkbM family methyltransferase